MSYTLEQQRAIALANARARAAAAEKAQPQRGQKRGFFDEAAGAMANFNRGTGIGDELAAAGGVVTGTLTGRYKLTDKVVPAFKRELAAQRGREDDFSARRPNTAALARGTGMAATVAIPTGGQANVFAQGSRVANAARGATMAGLQGAAYSAVDRGTAEERLRAASDTAMNPFVLGLGAVGGAVATPRAAPRRKPVNSDVELLAREGVQMTPGQMRGGLAKAAEDAGTSQPILGQAITDRREEGFDTFGRAVINRALKKVDDALPEGMFGTDAVKYAGDKISKGYETAIPGRLVRADAGFADDARAAFANVGTMTPRAQRQLDDILNQRVTSRLPQNGVMDGNLYKLIQSDLDYEVSRFSSSTDADQRAIGQAIEGVQTALEKAARRQDPSFAKRIDALDSAWAELARIETAAAKTNDLSGRFSPQQYAQAVKGADGRVRRRGVARGEALSQDLAGAGVRVLPSKLGESGTAPRAMWGMVSSIPGAAVGGLAGGGPGAVAGIAATAGTLKAASRAYSPQAIQAANAALQARIGSREQEDAIAALAEMAARDPNAQALYREVAARLSRVAGAAGAASGQQQPNPFALP